MYKVLLALAFLLAASQLIHAQEDDGADIQQT